MTTHPDERPPRHSRPFPGGPARSRGITPPEVLVLLAVVFLVAMVVLSALPRRRESARLAGCRRNLMQIGIALALYGRSERSLPVVPLLSADPVPSGGPLKAVLDALVLPDLTGLTDASTRPAPRPGSPPGERPVPGFVCPSDRTLTGPAPVSYRATAGDRPDGANGGFAPGRPTTLGTIEAGDGLGFTAAFSERLLGNRRPDDPGPARYSVVAGPVGDAGCPPSPPADRRGDAGSSWSEAGWRSTLYNHTRAPGAVPSCIARDGLTAHIGASSGHQSGVNVLIFDGSVRTVIPTVALPVWKALATTSSNPPGAADGPPPAPTEPEPR